MSGGEAVILESSPVGESQSNGHAEQAVRAIQGQIRTIKHQLELNVGCKIDSANPVWPWLIEFAGQVIRCFGKHLSDGLTPRERIAGHASLPPIAHFGERVLFKPSKTVLISKDEPRWREGVFLGFMDTSTEYIIGTPLGIVKCRSIRRRDASEQFDIQSLESLQGTPWCPVPSREGLRIPTNIEGSGEIVDDMAEVDGAC